MKLSAALTHMPPLIGLLLACSGPQVQLDPTAQHILLKRGPEPAADMRVVGNVECAAELYGDGRDANAISCENDLLNQAAAMQGTLVIVDSMDISEDSAHMRGRVFAPAQ